MRTCNLFSFIRFTQNSHQTNHELSFSTKPKPDNLHCYQHTTAVCQLLMDKNQRQSKSFEFHLSCSGQADVSSLIDGLWRSDQSLTHWKTVCEKFHIMISSFQLLQSRLNQLSDPAETIPLCLTSEIKTRLFFLLCDSTRSFSDLLNGNCLSQRLISLHFPDLCLLHELADSS